MNCIDLIHSYIEDNVIAGSTRNLSTQKSVDVFGKVLLYKDNMNKWRKSLENINSRFNVIILFPVKSQII